jgi:hypothetical protein
VLLLCAYHITHHHGGDGETPDESPDEDLKEKIDKTDLEQR